MSTTINNWQAFPVAAGNDNRIWLFPTGNQSYAAIDPSQAQPVLQFLQSRQARLSHILLTHHHHDHIGGVSVLQQQTHAQVIGSFKDQHRLPPLDTPMHDGATLLVGEHPILALEVPGHTLGSMAYQWQNSHLFTGDTLFPLGCGRLFEGDATTMWQSLLRLSGLNDDLLVCSGHEYSRHNLAFALHLDPNQPQLLSTAKQIAKDLKQFGTVTPMTLGREKCLNPFLQPLNPSFCQRHGFAPDAAIDCFAAIRRRKDNF